MKSPHPLCTLPLLLTLLQRLLRCKITEARWKWNASYAASNNQNSTRHSPIHFTTIMVLCWGTSSIFSVGVLTSFVVNAYGNFKRRIPIRTNGGWFFEWKFKIISMIFVVEFFTRRRTVVHLLMEVWIKWGPLEFYEMEILQRKSQIPSKTGVFLLLGISKKVGRHRTNGFLATNMLRNIPIL